MASAGSIVIDLLARTGSFETDMDRAAKSAKKRADEIRAWLVNWGVEPERLDARGIGSKRPLVPKSSKGAEQINDRVEFIIFERQ